MSAPTPAAPAQAQADTPRTARALVEAQANDPALWFVARTAPEGYLQNALRELHAAVEAPDAARQGAAPAAGAGAACPMPWTGDDGSMQHCKEREHCGCDEGKKAPAPSKGAVLTYDPNAYRSVRRDQTEAVVRAFNADPEEFVELLDVLCGTFCRTHERDPRIADVEHYAGKLRFYAVRMT